jgi:CheY-like chemotaxis protein
MDYSITLLQLLMATHGLVGLAIFLGLILVLALLLYRNKQIGDKNKELQAVNRQLQTLNAEQEKISATLTNRLNDTLQKMNELSECKTSFWADLNHRIRTPLNGLLGFSQALLLPGISGKEKEAAAHQIQLLCKKIIRLADEMVDLAKIEANQLEIHPTSCNINEMLRGIYRQLTENREYMNRQVTLELALPLNDEQAFMVTDAEKLKKTLLHCLGRLLKLTDSDAIEVGYKVDSPASITFHFREVRQPYSFISSTKPTPKKSGQDSGKRSTGQQGEAEIGMIIAKGYAKVLNGELDLDSTSDNGATFYLRLPLNISKKRPSGELFCNPENWSGKTILVVEDDLINYLYLEALLKRTNVRLIHAKNGEDALEIALLHPEINLMLLDLRLPFMDGFAVASAIRKQNHDIPIVTTTASSMADEEQRSLDAGCNAFIAKPLDPDELYKTLLRYIR